MPKIDFLVLGLYILLSVLATLVCKPGQKWKGLLFTSLLFYSYLTGLQVLYVLALAAMVYGLSFFVHKHPSRSWITVVLILLPLLVLKVTDSGLHFFQDNPGAQAFVNYEKFRALFQFIGLSYFTFNALSYLLDIRRRYIEPERNPAMVCLYLLYFPCAISGPLHRAKYLFAQFRATGLSDRNLARGLRLILLGMFKQLVLAQRCSWLLQLLLASQLNGIYFLFAGLVFFIYLYLNFSSFIDIFQGVSRIFNVELKDNFRNRIYLAHSRQDFWGGWHITLNEWFRDYFFFPLAKRDRARRYTDLILLATFLLIALWHGVTRVFLVWGTLNACWIILEKKVNLQGLPFPRFLKVAGVLYHLGFASLLALVFITPDLRKLSSRLFTTDAHLPVSFFYENRNSLAIVAGGFVLLDLIYARAGKQRFDLFLENKPVWVRWGIYFLLAIIIICLGVLDSINNYYAQF
ncbi:MAG: hypothetical protein EOO09_16915 [Chitinophagaceae bacterium]|nr:MAG: hypothetical protein EOO09_16915 [Chitinophagaceae bacterium]